MPSPPVSLPADVWRVIFVLSTPSTVRSCERVCHQLRDIVKSDIYLQYLLELDSCGYVEPANPRRDLTYHQKLEVVRNHRDRWNHPENITPAVFDANIEIWVPQQYVNQYVDSVFAWAAPLSDFTPYGRVQQLHIHQLPSPNRGIEYKHWVIPDLGLDVRNFGIDPAQDLLVLLEIDLESPHGMVDRLHLRTMSTNEVHPSSAASGSVLFHHSSTASPLAPDRTCDFGISGRLLAVLFRPTHIHPSTYLVIWDWTTGVELSRIDAIGSFRASFALLSEDSFVLPRFSRSHCLEINVPGDSYGFLDVYQFDPHASTSTEPFCVASFALPPLDHQNVKSYVHIRCAPTNVTPPLQMNPTPISKVFELAPENRLLNVDIGLSPIPILSGSEMHAGTLYIPSSLLLREVSNYQQRAPHKPNCIVVPWADWADATSWADIHRFSGHFGQRVAVLISDSRELGDPRTNALLTFDFDQHRLKSRHALNSPVGQVRSPGGRTMFSDFDQIGQEVFCAGAARASRRYVEMVVPLKEAVNRFSRVMIDDEHVIIYETRPVGNERFSVYTF